MSRVLSHSATAWNNIEKTHVKVFWFTSCRPVFRSICDDSQLCLVCPLINYTLATEGNVRGVQVCA